MRLSRVLSSVISDYQSAFLLGSHISDGVVVANEMLDSVKRSKVSGILFKVDFVLFLFNVTFFGAGNNKPQKSGG